MTQENATKKSSFEIFRDSIEHFSRILPTFVVTIYFFGYIVTAFRLAQYGVSTTALIEAQYFAAGMVPGLLVWLTFYILVSAFYYDPHKKDGKLTSLWFWANLLFIILVLILLMSKLVFRAQFDEMWSDLFPEGLPFILFLGELGLWILIIDIRKRKNFSTNSKRISQENFLSKIESILILKKILFPILLFFRKINLIFFTIVLIAFIFLIPSIGLLFYEELPQAYGGGKTQTVQLYVDSQKVPIELLDTNNTIVQASIACTVPLNLIFQTSTEYVVTIEDNNRSAWVLNADVVYAELKKLEK